MLTKTLQKVRNSFGRKLFFHDSNKFQKNKKAFSKKLSKQLQRRVLAQVRHPEALAALRLGLSSDFDVGVGRRVVAVAQRVRVGVVGGRHAVGTHLLVDDVVARYPRHRAVVFG